MHATQSFSERLTELRTTANLTNGELAEMACVPRSLIAGLQSGKRRAGELQARKIAHALDLKGEEFDLFVFEAINQCTRKVLKEVEEYPAEVLNELAMKLKKAGIQPDHVAGCTSLAGNMALDLYDGRHFEVQSLIQPI